MWLGEPEIMKRFFNDAHAAARLQHPNIVRIIDVKPEDEPRFIIMEQLAESLRNLMDREGQLSVRRSARIATEVCSALELAHAHGIIHRDIKPENLLVASTGEIKVCDFGIAHLPGDLGGGGTVLTPGQGHPGTLAYRSPEQVEGLMLDGRSDLYTVGAVLYEIRTEQLRKVGSSALTSFRPATEIFRKAGLVLANDSCGVPQALRYSRWYQPVQRELARRGNRE